MRMRTWLVVSSMTLLAPISLAGQQRGAPAAAGAPRHMI
jgi:hypothetical protein